VMENHPQMYVCINCARTDAQAPILRLRFQGADVSLCSSCLPVLLHRPDKLVGRLKGAESIQPASHGDD